MVCTVFRTKTGLIDGVDRRALKSAKTRSKNVLALRRMDREIDNGRSSILLNTEYQKQLKNIRSDSSEGGWYFPWHDF